VREAGRNVEVMWLTGRLVPDHKTIADFRKDDGPAIGKVCARFPPRDATPRSFRALRFVRKCVAPMRAFILPNGCSTVSRRWRMALGFASRRC
jgi:hypothetical protein